MLDGFGLGAIFEKESDVLADNIGKKAVGETDVEGGGIL